MLNFLTSVFSFFGNLIVLAATLYLILFVYFNYFEKKKKGEKIEPPLENANVETKKLPKENPNDFYGLHKMRNNEKAFLKDVEEKEKILENGGQIGANAAEALFLMRNSRLNKMVISEDGLLTIQKKIMNFQAPLAEGEMPRIISKELPYYIARVEELADGGYRQWFTPEHTAECGVKTIRYDAHGRSRGDPEMEEDDGKNKKGKPSFGNESNGTSAAEALLADISKKMSRQNEMLADVLVDKKLEEVVLEVVEKPKQQKFNPKQKIVASILLPKNNEDDIVENINSNGRYKDDIQKLEELLPPPDFFAIESDDALNNSPENITAIKDDGEENNSDAVIKLEDHSAKIKFDYIDYVRFIAVQAGDELFVRTILKKVFSEKSIGNVFIDFENSIVLIEKNHFAKTIREILEKEDRDKFDRDFFSKGAIGIYDGVKITEMMMTMNFRKDFIGTGKNNSKIIFNHLLESTDVEGVCFSGWFLKMAIDNRFASDFLSENMRGCNATIIASDVADVEKISKQFKNVKKFY